MKTRKILSLCLALVMVLSMLPNSIVSANDTCEADTETNAVAEICERAQTSETADANVNSACIAAEDTVETPTLGAASGTTGACTWTLNGTELTVSGNGAMGNYNSTYNSSLSRSVTTAPWGGSITKVIINSGVNSIGSSAFYGCSSLTSVTIPDGVTYIGSNAFCQCTNLTKIDLPKGLTAIEETTFYCCTRLVSIVIPDGVISIGDKAFYSCNSLTQVTIPDSVNSMGNNVFYNTDWYHDQPDGVIYAGMVVYKYKGTCPSNVIIKDGTLGIAECAFYQCTNLASITIPDSVTSIGRYAFLDTAWYDNQPDGMVYAGKVAYGYKGTCPSEVIIKDGTLGIACGAFLNCTDLINVTIPNSVTVIGDQAFDCCTGLSEISIPESIRSIGGFAFYYCTGLKSIAIPKNVEYIDDTAFRGCGNLTNISVEAGNNNYYSVNNCLINKSTKTLMLGCANSIIPSDGSVQSIADSAFMNCDQLTTLFIPSSVSYIGEGAFENCIVLKSIIIPDGITSIFGSTFSRCTSLTDITIPQSVINIKDYAFNQCSSLTKVYYGGAEANKNNISIGTNNTYLTNSMWIYATCTGTGHVYNNIADTICYACGKSRRQAPESITMLSYSVTEIILLSEDGVEYSIDNTVWQSNPAFTNLTPGSTYTVYARFVKEEDLDPSASCSIEVTLDKQKQTGIPDAPAVESYTCSSVTLAETDGCEYSIDGENWQSGASFTGLTEGVTYAFYQRYAATATTYAGKCSKATSFKVGRQINNEIPGAPIAETITVNAITLKLVSDCEYSIDGTTWQDSPEFTDLACGTEYTFYQRYAETDTTFASVASAGLKVKTEKGTKAAPAAPTAASVTHNTVILVAVEGCQYSRDTVNWQDSPLFVGLEAETNYAFFMRYAETDTHFASPASKYIFIKTAEEPETPEVTPGDMNSDGNITSDDAIYLLKYVFSPESYPISEGLNPDCNGDTRVTSDDAIYLLKYVFSPESYPLSNT